MDLAHFCRRLAVGDQAVTAGIATWRLVVWLFMALVALFLTHPVADPRGGPAPTAEFQQAKGRDTRQIAPDIRQPGCCLAGYQQQG